MSDDNVRRDFMKRVAAVAALAIPTASAYAAETTPESKGSGRVALQHSRLRRCS